MAFLDRLAGFMRGWTLLKAAVPAGAMPGGMPPEALIGWAQGNGIRHIVLDVGRVQKTYPALRPLLTDPPPGLVEVARSPGWRILALESP